MLVLTRKTRESVVIGRPEDSQIVLEITILEIEGGRVRLGFTADKRMPIHRREVWDRICNGMHRGIGNDCGEHVVSTGRSQLAEIVELHAAGGVARR